MKLVKRLLKILLALFALLLIILIGIVAMDSFETSYLKVKNQEAVNKSTYLITNVNIIPMNQDTVLLGKTVYVKEGLIESISEDINIKGIEVIDGKGKYLLPGLIDMHVHVWDEYELGLYLSNGVTAVRNLWGMPMHLRMKESINDNKIISPLFFTTSPKLTGSEFIGDDNLNLHSPNEAQEKIISYKERGYDLIKTYYGLDKELFDAILQQAAISDIDIVAHPSQKVPFSYHLHSQIKSIEHTEEIVQQPLEFDLDTNKLRPIIKAIAASKNTSYCPTLTVFHNIYQMLENDSILETESLLYINPLIKKVDSKNQFDRWYGAKLKDPTVVSRIKKQHEFHLYITKQLYEAGVPIICGTDAGIGITLPGFSIHKELAFYKQAGLSNYEILKTATINAAQTHSIMNQMGSIEVGKIANFLIVDNNPLVELSTLKNPLFVFVKGRKLNRETLTLYKEKAKTRKNLLASGLRYVENLIIEK